jgi:NAD(P)-dependent dehydrogenase (short-subunit alcohol dehydrogenase family)
MLFIPENKPKHETAASGFHASPAFDRKGRTMSELPHDSASPSVSRRTALLGVGAAVLGLRSAPLVGATAGASLLEPAAAPARHEPARGDLVVLVTGSTDGLGRAVAIRLARQGSEIIVHGRNRERGAEVVSEITRAGGTARFYAADLASFAQVNDLVVQILRDYSRLDVLINNAGIWLDGPRQTSADGHELHFQVNYLSGYLLTRALLPLLRKSTPSRVVNVASGAQQPIDFADVMLTRGYNDGRAYAQSKLAQVMFTIDLARELLGSGVTVTALHPATYMDTGMVVSRGIQPRSSVEEGAEAVVHLATADGLRSGEYFNGSTPARANAQAYDEAARERLARLSRELTGAP